MCYRERAEACDIGTVAQRVDVGRFDRALLTQSGQSPRASPTPPEPASSQTRPRVTKVTAGFERNRQRTARSRWRRTRLAVDDMHLR